MSERTVSVLDDAEGALALEQALRVVPGVLERLRAGYAALEARAERVERELVRANAELEREVAQQDALKRHLEAVLESLPCGVLERDADGRVVRVNAAAQRLLGVPARALLERREHPALPAPAADGEPRALVCADGQRRVLASHCATVRSSAGEVVGSLEILDDRTEATALAERLHAADKMAALGTLTAGVAHEIRNPLNAVKGFASLLRRSLAEDELDARRRAWVEHVVAGASEMDAIVENMLTFGSPERLRLEEIEPAALLREAIDAARAHGSAPAAFAPRVACSAPVFHGDRIKLRQALRNLVENALEVQGDRPRVLLAAEADGADVLLRVADGGPGVPTAVGARVFDPFFTTRAEGTGLGLALVATIARLHGGRAELSPHPSPLGGAEFVLRIPRQAALAPLDPS